MRKAAHNNTFAIGGISYSADSLMIAESEVLRMNICGEKPAHCKYATVNQTFNMKGLLIIWMLIITVSNACGQTSKMDTTFYPNGQVNTIDSLYDSDTIRLHKQYYADIESTDSGTMYLGNSGWTQIESSGEFLLMIGERGWTQHGKWTYWDKKGKVYLETYSPNDGLGTRYINQWFPNGNQILKKGNGHYYSIWPRGSGVSDSIVSEVRDSVKHGHFKTWRKESGEQAYYLYRIGFFNKNEEEGLQTTYYKDGSLRMLFEYHDSAVHGIFQKFYQNGNIMESGHKDRHNDTGNWKYWNENGILIKECNYEKGRLKGKYTEYYPNGLVKLTGNYVHINGQDSVYTEDLLTGELTMEIMDTDDIPAKDGQWQYYRSNGELIKTEIYDKGHIIKE